MKLQDNSPRAGAALFTLVFLLFVFFLLSQLGAETKYSASGKLFAQPRFWPAVALIGMAFFGMAYFLSKTHRQFQGSVNEALVWLRSLEYAGWFMGYVVAVPYIGYLLATVIFTTALTYRQGYRSIRQLIVSAVLGAFIVLIFKTLLSVKIPGGAIYEYLPSALRSFMITNF